MSSKKRVLQHENTRRGFIGGSLALGAMAAGASASAQATPEATAVSGAEVVPAGISSQPEGQFPLTEEKKTLTVLVSTNGWVGDFVENDFTKWYEERTNVHIEWTVLPADDAAAALNVRLASGDLPDILLSTNPSAAVQQLYGSLGTFLPLNDLIEQHGVYTKHVFEQYPIARTNVTASDGNIYSLPTINDCYHCSMAQKLWVYQPWIDAYGSTPTTLEEYADYLRWVKENDPNGNGTADEVPLTSSPDQWNGSYDQYFMNSFVFTPNSRRYVEDGEVKFSYNQEGWREGIKYLAGLYAEGLIDAESFTQDYDGMVRQATMDPNTVACFPGGWIGNIASDWDHGSLFKTLPPLEGPDGTRIASYNNTGAAVPGVFIITEACQDPELAFRWADGLYEYETTTRSNMGVKDVHWRWAQEGETGIDGNQGVWMKLEDLPSTQTACWSQTGNGFRTSEWRLGEVLPPDTERDRSTETILYDQTKENYEPYAQPAEMNLPVMFFTEEQSTVIAEAETAIVPYVEETLARAIIGGIDIEAEWDNYLATLEAMGIAQYRQTFQDAYDAKMSN